MNPGSVAFGLASRIRSWMRATAQRRRLERDMELELADHLERLTSDLIAAGHNPHEASRRARIALGPALKHKEDMRSSLGLQWMDQARDDLRFAVRQMRRNPRFAIIGALSLALAIGANSTLFAVVKQLLYTPLAVPHADQLRLLRWWGDGNEAVHGMWGDFDSAPGQGTNSSVFSYPVYQQLRAHNDVLQDLIGFKDDGMNATIRGEAQRVSVEMVSGNYYGQLRVRPQVGRAITEADTVVPGSGAVAVISDGLWARSFGRSPVVVGQTITLNQSVVTIVGVNPPGFTGLKLAQQSPDLFVPLSLQPVIDPKGKASLLTDPGLWWVNIMARSRDGITDLQAQSALNFVLQGAVRSTLTVRRGETMPRLVLTDGSRGLRVPDRVFRMPLLVLWALTGFVLLLACANVANLLLARAAQRRREMSVRLALGAARGRLLRQLLTESVLLAFLGGVGGLVLTYFGRNLLPRLLTEPWQRAEFNTAFDAKVFAFTTIITLITSVLFGLAPAWLSSRLPIGGALKETALQTTRRRKGLSGKALVSFQVALSTILVLGAGVFLRTIWSLGSVDVGFNPDNLLLLEIEPPVSRYPAGKDVNLHMQLEQRFTAVPGVESVAAGYVPYISDNMSNETFLPEGEISDPHRRQAEAVNWVGTDFFKTLEIPILAGRAFGIQDTATSPKVGIINESLARKRFGSTDVVGKRFKADQEKSDWIQIVGVCRDTRYVNLRTQPPAQFFLPFVQQKQVGRMVYQVRTHVPASTLAPLLRKIVQQVDPDLPVTDIRTQRDQINAAMQLERAVAVLTVGFGLLAMSLSAVGIYGVMAYSVAQRTNEIGIRLAVGARPVQVRGMILQESSRVTGIGLVCGIAVALGLTHLVRSMLFGIETYDPPTILVTVGVLVLVALGATWIPARRAAALQPMDALRNE
ncbi:ABC transporter permease [Terriglobus albidus]|uniref:ABC transporter permease n=1 Tax=Terriglobus albidus TaxID=1592106 RepID=UPI0021DFB667|nr:ABC transporter permease [Terriglobus albidus]